MSSTIYYNTSLFIYIYTYIHVYYVHKKRIPRSQVEAASTRLSMAVGIQSWVVMGWPSLKLRVRTWKWWLEDELFFFVGGGGCCGCCFYLLVWNFRRIQKQQLVLVISIKKKAFMKCLSSLQQGTREYPTKSQIKCQLVWGGDKRCTIARGSTGGDFLSWLYFNRC